MTYIQDYADVGVPDCQVKSNGWHHLRHLPRSRTLASISALRRRLRGRTPRAPTSPAIGSNHLVLYSPCRSPWCAPRQEPLGGSTVGDRMYPGGTRGQGFRNSAKSRRRAGDHQWPTDRTGRDRRPGDDDGIGVPWSKGVEIKSRRPQNASHNKTTPLSSQRGDFTHPTWLFSTSFCVLHAGVIITPRRGKTRGALAVTRTSTHLVPWPALSVNGPPPRPPIPGRNRHRCLP